MVQHYNSPGDWQFLNEAFLKEWEQKLSNIKERYSVESSLYEFFKSAWPYVKKRAILTQ
jgi:hypothetical protein